MASIANDPHGRKRVIVLCPGGQRRAIRLGKVDRRSAEAFRLRVEKLVGAIRTDSPLDDDTADWLTNMSDDLHAKLAEIGLTTARAADKAQLKKFIDLLIFAMTGAKPRTRINMQRARDLLVERFGATRDMRTIHVAEAEDWRTWLATEKKLGDNTVRRLIGRARQIWKRFIKRGGRGANPFDGLPATVRANKAREFFVTRDVANAVIDQCPSTEWKLIVALSRYGGLRCPSEHLALKWSDVNWEKNRLRVPSPKTEHHEGHEERIIPLFPELYPYLRAAFEEAEEGTQHVIVRYRSNATNLRSSLKRYINAAGHKPWPKLFHNMRASRQTELAQQYGEHIACAWLGNSRAVAREHYLMVPDAIFEDAARQPARAAHAGDCQPLPKSSTGQQETANCQSVASGGNGGQTPEYPRQGPKYPQKSTETQGISRSGGAPSGAPVARRAERLRHPSVRRATHKIRAALAAGVRKGRAKR
jgi:integrase